ncbi:PREDICTED: uncharacterized protein LOC107162914, partial [Diuraphis noxia]|uniref:uncharacterized protein LOC107162914 n=1 Tax=Diuraphis noxia TaxID=143948 RepID=UPI000763757F
MTFAFVSADTGFSAHDGPRFSTYCSFKNLPPLVWLWRVLCLSLAYSAHSRHLTSSSSSSSLVLPENGNHRKPPELHCYTRKHMMCRYTLLLSAGVLAILLANRGEKCFVQGFPISETY